MTATLLIALVLFGGGQDDSSVDEQDRASQIIAVSNLYTGELMLFSRWTEKRGFPPGIIDGSTWSVLTIDATKAQLDALLADFSKEFGVDLAHVTGGRPRYMFPAYDVSPQKPVTASLFFSGYANGSLVKEAYEKGVKDGDITKDTLVVACTYTLRPWLSVDGKRTERVFLRVNDRYVGLL